MNEKKILARFSQMNGQLDDQYTLYDDGSILRIYDANIYPGNQDLEMHLTVAQLKSAVKSKLLERSGSNYDQVKKILDL